MGKTRTLRSSIKAIHETLTSFIPAGPTCMQQNPRTESFKDQVDLPAGIDSAYYTAHSSSSSSATSAASSIFLLPTSTVESQTQSCELISQPLPSDDLPAPVEPTSFSSSSASSSSAATVSTSIPNSTGAIIPVDISSKRFFFSPSTTNSIMEETKANHHVIRKPDERFFHKRSASLSEESVPLVVSSEDPYKDFRVSMEEMVEAHGLKDWSGLQELLDCYLHLNDKKTHKIILVAFVDLLMSFVCQGGTHSSSSSVTTTTTTTTSSTTNLSSLLPNSPYSSSLLQFSSSE